MNLYCRDAVRFPGIQTSAGTASRCAPRMIEIYILRHAIAKSRENWRGKPDSERPLTTKGEKKMTGEARAMRAAGLKFDLIVSSPFARASRTAEIVARILRIRRELKFCQSL